MLSYARVMFIGVVLVTLSPCDLDMHINNLRRAYIRIIVVKVHFEL